MDRELVISGLLVITVGMTLLKGGTEPRPIKSRFSARHRENAASRALWLTPAHSHSFPCLSPGWSLASGSWRNWSRRL